MVKRTSTRTKSAAQAPVPSPLPKSEPKPPTSYASVLMRFIPIVAVLVILVGGAGYYVHASNSTKPSEVFANEGTVQEQVIAAIPIVADVLPQETSEPTPPEEVATIEVRNGTQTAGLARVLTEQLKGMGLNTLTPTDAQNKTYTKTKILVSSSKSFPETVKKLIEATGGEEVDSLPNEGSTRADILIIVGK